MFAQTTVNGLGRILQSLLTGDKPWLDRTMFYTILTHALLAQTSTLSTVSTVVISGISILAGSFFRLRFALSSEGLPCEISPGLSPCLS